MTDYRFTIGYGLETFIRIVQHIWTIMHLHPLFYNKESYKISWAGKDIKVHLCHITYRVKGWHGGLIKIMSNPNLSNSFKVIPYKQKAETCQAFHCRAERLIAFAI